MNHPTTPNRRNHLALREFVANTMRELDAGHITVRQACEMLNAQGVPFEVARRAVRETVRAHACLYRLGYAQFLLARAALRSGRD